MAFPWAWWLTISLNEFKAFIEFSLQLRRRVNFHDFQMIIHFSVTIFPSENNESIVLPEPNPKTLLLVKC